MLTRLATECEAHFNLVREWPVPKASRYGCLGCGTVFRVTADGVHRIPAKVKPEADPNAKPKPHPGMPEQVIPRLPRARV